MKRIIAAALMMSCISCAAQAVTINYGDVTHNPGYSAVHFNDIYDLTQGDLVLSYSIDMSAITQTSAYQTPYAEVGIRQVGAGDFNPGPFGVYQGGAGGWMTSLVGDLATNPTSLDLDDKHNLGASGGRGEADYDVYGTDMDTVLSPFGNQDTIGFWYDRDGVDPYQNTFAANTAGTYDIVITYHAISDSLGTMIATINGNGTDIVSQEFRIDGVYTGPAGLSFTGDMTQMQIFTGAWWDTGTAGSISVSDITSIGTLYVPEPATLALLGLGGLLLRKRK